MQEVDGEQTELLVHTVAMKAPVHESIVHYPLKREILWPEMPFNPSKLIKFNLIHIRVFIDFSHNNNNGSIRLTLFRMGDRIYADRMGGG